MKTIYFDPIPGASGDMILASLIDLGADTARLKKDLRFVPGSTLIVKQVMRSGVSAKQVRFITKAKIGEKEFLPLIARSRLPGAVKDSAVRIVKRIFQAEMKVHRARHLHLHELADADTLLDITGTLIAINDLGIDKVYTRPLKAGTGFVKTREGRMPAHNFATAQLLKGFPVEFLPIPYELTTPTGAAVLSTIAEPADDLAFTRVERIGLGTGTMEFAGYPNFLRAFLGEIRKTTADECLVIETNIDDQNPQDFEIVFDRLYAAGALEVFLTPVIMKNSRPGVILTVLGPAYSQDIVDVLFEHTSTLGIRMHRADRIILERRIVSIPSPFGKIRTKIYEHDGRKKFSLEYRDLKKIALKTGRPLAQLRDEIARFAGSYLNSRRLL
jgi:uncharacterized protein (TIGR00299 family) protein